MKYRKLGKTELMVSEIGIGGEHIDRAPYKQVQETVGAALDNGVNIIDCFMPGTEIRKNIAKALGDKRSNVIIQGALGSSDVREQYDKCYDMPVVIKYFEEMLHIFGYVDIAMLFNVDTEKNYEAVYSDEFLSYALSLKQKGDIRHIGISTHNPKIADAALKTGVPEVLFFSLNPAFDMLPPDKHAVELMVDGFDSSLMHGIDPTRAELYRFCEHLNIGITVMKTFGGGKFISPQHSPFETPLSIPQCIHYALTRPAVSSVLLGCRSAAEVEDAMKYYTATDSERDYTQFMGTMQNDVRGQCVYCNHCLPCPVDIDIAAVMKYLDRARLTPDAIPESLRDEYAGLSASGCDCISCGAREERCPFGVKIVDNMTQAAELFA